MKHPRDLFSSKLVGAAAALFAVATFLTTPLLAQGSGHKQTDKLIKTAESTLDAVGIARQQVKDTLASYNAIMGGKVDDNKAAYKTLVKAIDQSDKKAMNVRKKMESMQASADTLFGDWESSLATFTSDDMRQRSKERLDDTRERYSEILTAGQKASGEFGPFISTLRDQVRFLGHDLNPAAVSDLEEDAVKLNEQADKVLTTIDDAVKVAEEYIESLRAEG